MLQNRYDVVVVGGGLAGAACALRAAESGKQTIIVERRPALGWESTWAGQLDFTGADSPVAQRILDLLSAVGGYRAPIADGPILEMALDRIIREAGVDLLLHAYPVRLIEQGDTAFGVVLGSRSGEQILQARVVVDATEDGLLWSQTSAPAESNEGVTATQVFFMNHAEDGIEFPSTLVNGTRLMPSLWRGEVRIEYEVEAWDILAARRQLPQRIQQVRDQVPALREALVSHIANEPFPKRPLLTTPGSAPNHPTLHNFFAAGIWASDQPNTPAGRIRLGEIAGEQAVHCEGASEFPGELMTGSVFHQPETQSDLVVVGGGTGGAIAAIVAGREGLRTTLIEASPTLGGMGTGGAIHAYCAGLSGGIQDEVDARVRDLTPLLAGKWRVMGFEPEAKKLALQQMAEEAGVEILLNTVVTGVLLKSGEVQTSATEPGTQLARSDKEEPREIHGVLAATPAGVSMYGGRVFIDSTGDGDVAAMAGASFIIGREKDNLPHAFSQAAGALDPEHGSLRFFNFDAGYVDPTDVTDMTRARRLGVQLYWREQFTEKNRLLYMAPLVGLRQGRQIIGDYQLTLADEIAGRRFDDAISFMQAFYDNHGFDYENESERAALWVWVLGGWSTRIGCEIPYRCLLPKGIDGLILACRALSMTYDAHAAFRMQKDIQRIGEVAALAAAQAIRKGVSVRQIDVHELQPILKERGVLDEQFRPRPAIADVPVRQLPSLAEDGHANATELVWLATLQGEEGLPLLKEALQSDDAMVRFKASAAFAMHGSSEGVPELLRSLQERDEGVPEGRKQTPKWQSAITFLGMAADPSTLPALLAVLQDPDSPLDALIATVRALGRLQDASVLPTLHALLERTDLDTVRTLQVSTGGIAPSKEDARWQLDLVTAETMFRLGEASETIRQIAAPYLEDERAYVRRYARRVSHQAGL